ncbi:hypothetical protein JSY36_04925 [Bacillus sp. H-16]|uniref:hypothetical protein n=1 Tax=Alteribacter salitolerans TaxID=2912333 RepID=UPI0019657D78|nr:hypothetical protein [Alteribacter salitolerans]MBM7095095.1 hypothetical protein [Alteribacter salitolerans]
MILLLGMILILLPLTGYFIYSHSKLTGTVFMSAPLVFVLFLAGWWVMSVNHHFVSSTNLEEEFLGPFQLQKSLSEEKFDEFGSYEKREQDEGYSYSAEDFFLKTDKENIIVSLSAGAMPVETSSGLKPGDSLKKARLIYGEKYYTYREMGLGKATVYVDRAQRHTLTIWSTDDATVSNIWFSQY